MQIARSLFIEGNAINLFGNTGFAHAGGWSIDRGRGLFEVDPFPAGLYMGMLIMRDFPGEKFSNFSHFQISPVAGITLFLDGRIKKEDVEMAEMYEGRVIFKGIEFDTPVGRKPIDVVVTNKEVEFVIAAITKGRAAYKRAA